MARRRIVHDGAVTELDERRLRRVLTDLAADGAPAGHPLWDQLDGLPFARYWAALYLPDVDRVLARIERRA